MNTTDLPGLNAILNGICTALLIGGYIAVKRGNPDRHRKFMIAALTTSALFLISYVIYHARVGSVPYPHYDWTRPIYFAVLIPHVILAAVMAPFILAAVWFALKRQFDRHTRLTRWVWPVWVFVSLTGVIVYLMLYGI